MKLNHILIVCGDRDWYAVSPIRALLSQYDKNTTVVITGGQIGADTIGHNEAQHIGLTAISVPALWRVFERPAGPRRNAFMLQLAQALQLQQSEAVLHVHAFHDHLENSIGTKNMIDQAEQGGVSWTLYNSRFGQ